METPVNLMSFGFAYDEQSNNLGRRNLHFFSFMRKSKKNKCKKASLKLSLGFDIMIINNSSDSTKFPAFIFQMIALKNFRVVKPSQTLPAPRLCLEKARKASMKD